MVARADMETWETATHSVCAVSTYDARGNVKAKMVGGEPGRKVQLTADERVELNEEVAANAGVDIFRNGFLRPVRNVPEDVVSRFETETKRVGGLTVEEMSALFTLKGAEFTGRVADLGEPTLRLLLEASKDADASASQVEVVTEILKQYQVSGPDGTASRLTRADGMVRKTPAGVPA